MFDGLDSILHIVSMVALRWLWVGRKVIMVCCSRHVQVTDGRCCYGNTKYRYRGRAAKVCFLSVKSQCLEKDRINCILYSSNSQLLIHWIFLHVSVKHLQTQNLKWLNNVRQPLKTKLDKFMKRFVWYHWHTFIPMKINRNTEWVSKPL